MGRPRVMPCGTNAGYRRHNRNGERACDACLDAHAQSGRADNRLRQRALLHLAREHPARFLEILDALRAIAATEPGGGA